MTTHERLMGEAYEQFTDGMTLAEFYDELDDKHRHAVALGNLNYQVRNGGFVQWIENGYAEVSIPTLLSSIYLSLRAAEYPRLVKAIELADSAVGVWSHYQDGAEGEDMTFTLLDQLDSDYYRLTDGLRDEMNKYLEELCDQS